MLARWGGVGHRLRIALHCFASFLQATSVAQQEMFFDSGGCESATSKPARVCQSFSFTVRAAALMLERKGDSLLTGFSDQAEF